MTSFRRILPIALAFLLVLPVAALAGGVHVLFDALSPAGGPFPSDLFTVREPSHLTGVRVSLPKPDCVALPSDCADIDVLNTLDGFNLQPRLSIRGNRAGWEAQGAKDTYQLAREKVRKLARQQPQPLPPQIQARLDEIIASF